MSAGRSRVGTTTVAARSDTAAKGIVSDLTVRVSTAEYALDCLRRYSLPYWLVGGPDYSRSVEYPLAARLLAASPGDRLLDVGAGRMAEFAALMARRGLDVTAIDAREDVGAEAASLEGLRVLRADARKLEFGDGQFDRVTAISTIEHIEEGDDDAMRELARVLAPGGRLVATVPYNPLKRAEIFARDGVYGRHGSRVFFEHIYDDEALQARIIGPTGLRLVERVHLGEPGFRMSRLFYDKRGVTGGLRRVLPIGWLMGLLAPRFLRPVPPERIHFEDWTGVAVVLAFEK
jgi:SAM-dependent methyltransferase